jgi:peptidylprolyl isomerase
LASKQKNQKNRNAPRTRARTATQVRARERQRRNRNFLTTGGAAVIVLAIVGLMASAGTFSKSTTTTSTSSTSVAPTTTVTPTSAALPSVAGKPCVKVVGALPKGAPAVPVQTGPPPTKLVIKDLKAGTGAVVTKTQTLSVDYIGVACSTGKIFDSSYSRNQPASFALNQVIQGWQQGIPGMKVGGERLLGIPPALGYGASGQGSTIAPGETLWFVVHVRSAK